MAGAARIAKSFLLLFLKKEVFFFEKKQQKTFGTQRGPRLAFSLAAAYNPSMFRDLMFILLVLALLSVLAVLGAGLIGLVRGGDPRKSNKLMQWRVALQALALLLVVIILTIFRDR